VHEAVLAQERAVMGEVMDQDQTLREFLLHELDLKQREQVEEQFMLDESFRAQLLMVQDGLIEDYLDGMLDEVDRRQFESVFFASNELREKLAIAKAIRAAARPELRRARLFTALKVAAAVIAVLGIGWLIQRQLSGREHDADVARRTAIQSELARLNSGLDETLPGDTLVLAPVNTRGSEPPIVWRKSDVVELLLITTSRDNTTFKATITKDGARWSLEAPNLQQIIRPQGKVVRLRIPAQRLDPGGYSIELTGIAPNRDPIHAGEYRFELKAQ
jgi:hypothetical protein